MDQTPDLPVLGPRDLTLDLCACARSEGPAPITAMLLACPGVEAVHVDTYVTWALATFDPARTTPNSIVDYLAAAGFEVRVTRLFDPDHTTPEYPPRHCPPSPSPADQEPE